MSPVVLERISQIEKQAQPGSRISLTDLARSRKWREELIEYGIIEVVDHGETAAWLLSDADMSLLLGTIDSLLEEMESLQVSAIIDARSQRADWQSGNTLAKKAKASLKKRQSAMKKVLDGE